MKVLAKRQWTSFVAGYKASWPGRESNLNCTVMVNEFKDEQTSPFLLQIKNLVTQNRLAEAAAIVDNYVGAQFFTERGDPLYSLAAGELVMAFGDEHEDVEQNELRLEHYKQWYESSPQSPYAASAYALALQYTGHSHRGTDVASKVKDHQWAAMIEYNEKADEVYRRTHGQFYNHWFWAKSYLNHALTSSVDNGERWRRFDQCVETSPYDPSIYDRMAYMMLPRWHGSFEEVNKVAAHAATTTKEHMGEMMYACTLASVFDFHYLTEIVFNWPKLKQGFQDWLRLYPSDYVATQYACALYTMGEHREALGVMEGLEKLYVYAWDSKDDYSLANSVCLEFVKNYGPDEKGLW